uniref:Myopalladin n=1 Tax=Magallana gigas TaxID=29159 RepID=K1QEW3_MAGGI
MNEIKKLAENFVEQIFLDAVKELNQPTEVSEGTLQDLLQDLQETTSEAPTIVSEITEDEKTIESKQLKLVEKEEILEQEVPDEEQTKTLDVINEETARESPEIDSQKPVDEVSEINLEVDVTDKKFIQTVEGPLPRFISKLEDVTVKEGSSLSLKVEFEQMAEVIVRWFLDESEITSSEEIEIIVENNSTTLLIHDVLPEDEGEYKVVIENSTGMSQTSCYITVQGIDEGKQRERPKRKVSGISVEFSKPDEVSQTDINVAEQPQGISIEMDITEAPEISATEIVLTKQEEIVSSDKSALEITLESTPKPETIKTEETVDITVKEDKGVSEAPRFTKTLHRQFEATEGSSVTIECEVTGKETPVVTWYQDEEPITPDEHFVTEFEHGVCRLTIHNVFLEDEAEYKCEAVTSYGAISTVTELFVERVTQGLNQTSKKDLAFKTFVVHNAEELPKGEEEAQPLAEVQETPDLLEGLNTQTTEKVVPEKSEISTIETRGSDVVTSETEEVSFEIVTAESAETTPLEFTVQTESARPEKTEVPLKAAVPEVSEVVAKETEELISKDLEEEKPVEEVIAVEELLRPEEELPVSHTVPQEEDVEEVVEDEAAPEIPKGEAPVFTTTLEKLVVQEGQPVQFRCVVSGIPKPDIVWLLDDAVIEDSATYQVNKSHSFHFHRSFNNTGFLSCRITFKSSY